MASGTFDTVLPGKEGNDSGGDDPGAARSRFPTVTLPGCVSGDQD